jgi:hypothetical protein
VEIQNFLAELAWRQRKRAQMLQLRSQISEQKQSPAPGSELASPSNTTVSREGKGAGATSPPHSTILVATDLNARREAVQLLEQAPLPSLELATIPGHFFITSASLTRE